MNQYIITEEERKRMLRLWSIVQTHISYENDTFYNLLDQSVQDAYNLMESVHSRPYNPQAERERLIANIENWAWVNRSVFFNNNAYNPLILKLQELREGKGGEQMTWNLSRDELTKILKKAECCWSCKHNSYYNGIFHYCDLVRTKTENKPCYLVTAWQVCEHWCSKGGEQG